MYLGEYVIMHDHIHSIIGIVGDCNDIVILRPNLKNDKKHMSSISPKADSLSMMIRSF